MNNRAIHFSIITLLSIMGAMMPLTTKASAGSCLGHYTPAALLSPRAALSDYFNSSKFKGFLFTSASKESTQAVLKIIGSAQSGGDFVSAIRALLAIKSNWYMGGLADNNFNDQVIPGLFQNSKKYSLTSAEKREIKEILQTYSTSKYGSKNALVYKELVWGNNEFSTKLNQYTSSKDYKGFLSHDSAKDSTNNFLTIVSQAKSSGDFVEAVTAVLAYKSNKYFGGIADKNFDNLILPGLLNVSKTFELSSQDKSEINAVLMDYSESAMGSKTALIYTNLVWGKDQFVEQIEKYLTSSEYKGFLTPENATSSAKTILAIVTQAQTAGDFVNAVKAVLGSKANVYMGGIADNNFHSLILPGLLKASRSFTLSSQEQTDLSQTFKDYAKTPFGSPDAISYSNEIWGY